MPTSIRLKVFRGDELVRTEQFNREIIKIGRLASAHLCLDDDKISRIHSVIEVAPDGNLSIIDMGSAEGTFVNGKKVSRGALRLGDQITLGGLRIVLEVPEGAAGAATPVANQVSVDAAAVNRVVAVPAPTPAHKANGTNGTNGKAHRAAQVEVSAAAPTAAATATASATSTATSTAT